MSYVLGREVLGAGTETSHALLVRVKNAADLARSQGAVAALAQAIAPATIETKVYEEMGKQILDALRQKNVDAEVTVVDPAGWKPANGAHLWTDVGFMLGGGAIVALILHFLGGRK